MTRLPAAIRAQSVHELNDRLLLHKPDPCHNNSSDHNGNSDHNNNSADISADTSVHISAHISDNYRGGPRTRSAAPPSRRITAGARTCHVRKVEARNDEAHLPYKEGAV